MIYEKVILKNIKPYLKKINYNFEGRGKVLSLECPYCEDKSLTAQNLPNTELFKCLNPNCKNKKNFNLIAIVRKVEKDKKSWDRLDILQYLKDSFNLNVITPKDGDYVKDLFNYYSQNGWALLRLARYSKVPLKDIKWKEETETDTNVWLEWHIEQRLNLGMATGIKTNLTVIDIDCLTDEEAEELYSTKDKKRQQELLAKKQIPQEIKSLVGNTAIQRTRRGFNFCYLYDKELPQTQSKIKLTTGHKIDIRNDGGYVVVEPSDVDNYKRKFINRNKPIQIPEKFKQLILSLYGKKEETPKDKQLEEQIKHENFNFGLIQKGGLGRSNVLMSMGGVWRKRFNQRDTEYLVASMDKFLCDPPIGYETLKKTVFRSLSDYRDINNEMIKTKIYEYLQQAKSASSAMIEMLIFGARAKKDERLIIDKVLIELIQEEKISARNKYYNIIEQMDWTEDWIDIEVQIKEFEIPYFDDIAKFYYGNVILIGSETKGGKSTLAMNFVKKFVKQGIKPYYIYTEKGGFSETAYKLGLKKGDFIVARGRNPYDIVLPKNAIVIYDWVDAGDWSKTAALYRTFVEKTENADGFMVSFAQLREETQEFFAKEQSKQLMSLVGYYGYPNENDTINTEFKVKYLRKPKLRKRQFKLPCIFDWDTYEVNRVDQLPKKDNYTMEIQKLEEGKEEEKPNEVENKRHRKSYKLKD